MASFEITIVNSAVDRQTFDISPNEKLYDYLTTNENGNSHGEDWFDITLTQKDVETIKKLCKTIPEKKLIGENITEGTILDILIHRTITIGDD